MHSDAVNYEQTVAAAYPGAWPCTALQCDPSSPFLGTTGLNPHLLSMTKQTSPE